MITMEIICLLILMFNADEYYKNFCLNCHGDVLGKEKGKTYPIIFLPGSLIKEVTKTGFLPFMPPFQLTEEQLDELTKYITENSKQIYNIDENEINSSITTISIITPTFNKIGNSQLIKQQDENKIKSNSKSHVKDITVFVERGEDKIWIIDGKEVKTIFTFPNVHGGIKFWSSGFIIPSRGGELGQYFLNEGILKKVNVCQVIKNVEVLEEESKIFVSCSIPPAIIILDAQTLKVKSIINLHFQPVSVVKTKNNKVVVILPDSIGIIKSNGELLFHRVPQNIVSVLVEPFGEFIFLGRVQSIEVIGPEFNEVFSIKTTSPPHFFSSAFWYDKGNFYTAIPYLNSIIIVKMFDWEIVKSINFPDFVFFVRTHPNTNYLWADSGGYIYLINKYTFDVRRIEISGKEFHTEFSSDGSLAFITSRGENGGIIILDTATQKELSRFKAKNPAGKYNLSLRTKPLALLGFDIYKSKCWGCHHPTKAAFGPPLSAMNEAMIRAQINHPKDKMPKIDLSEREIEALVEFVKNLKHFFDLSENQN